MPGKHSTLLIWFGSPSLPVAITRAHGAASSGVTSGVGLAIANTIASFAMPLRAPAGITRAPERPTN